MKTKEELSELKQEYESFMMKLQELTDDELKIVAGGIKVVVNDDDPEDLSWWEKVLKIFFKN